MFLGRLVYRAFIGLCLLAFVGGLGYLALENWFGDGPRSVIRAILVWLRAWLPGFDQLEYTGKVVGPFGTALSAAWGVYKGLRYAEKRLPDRIKQLIEYADQRLLKNRTPLLSAIYETAIPSQAQSKLRARWKLDQSVFRVPSLNRALRQIGFHKLPEAEKSLGTALKDLAERIDIAERHTKSLRTQKVSAHILRGATLSAKADAIARAGVAAEKDREDAELEFSNALNLEAECLDALELRGRQRVARGNATGAMSDFESLSKYANKHGDKKRAAQGYRLRGEVHERRATPLDLRAARRLVDEGIKIMRDLHSSGPEDQLELGLLLKTLGRIRQNTKQKPGVIRLLHEAQNILQQLASVGTLNAARIKDHLSEIEQLLLLIDGARNGDVPAKGNPSVHSPQPINAAPRGKSQ